MTTTTVAKCLIVVVELFIEMRARKDYLLPPSSKWKRNEAKVAL